MADVGAARSALQCVHKSITSEFTAAAQVRAVRVPREQVVKLRGATARTISAAAVGRREGRDHDEQQKTTQHLHLYKCGSHPLGMERGREEGKGWNFLL